jgi:hypothetical protein
MPKVAYRGAGGLTLVYRKGGLCNEAYTQSPPQITGFWVKERGVAA